MKPIRIDQNVCKGCGLCLDQCPRKVFELSPRRNRQGYLIPAAKRPQDCNQCLLCEMLCPDMAITVKTREN